MSGAPSSDGNVQVPNIMFTIEPGSAVGVSANVADLVVAEVADDGVLRFSWNPQVASGALSGGVKITMPAEQLRSVVASQSERPDLNVFRINSYNNVQILEGFTSIDTLEVSSSSSGYVQVWASLTDVQEDLSVKVDGSGGVWLKSGNLKSLAVNGETTTVYADVDGSVDNLDVTGWGRVYLTAPGGIKNGSVNAFYGSMLEANSTVTGKMTVHSEGNLYNGKGASVFLPSCANVSTSGKATCTEEALLGWEVDPSRRPATREGTYTCAVAAYDDSTSSGTISGPTLTASLVVLLAVAASFKV